MESGNKKWAVSETRNLISQFEDSPCLWDVFNKDYKNNGCEKKSPYCLAPRWMKQKEKCII
jgi:hypothetical protein